MGTMKKTISSTEYLCLVTWLKERRQAMGLSMRELAELIGEPHSVVQKVEMLQRRLDVYEYSVYCKALGLDPREGMKFFK